MYDAPAMPEIYPKKKESKRGFVKYLKNNNNNNNNLHNDSRIQIQQCVLLRSSNQLEKRQMSTERAKLLKIHCLLNPKGGKKRSVLHITTTLNPIVSYPKKVHKGITYSVTMTISKYGYLSDYVNIE